MGAIKEEGATALSLSLGHFALVLGLGKSLVAKSGVGLGI